MFQLLSYSRSAMQLLMGLCLGLGFSLIVVTFVEELHCRVEQTAVTPSTNWESSTTSATGVGNKGAPKPRLRPRYASTELGIRDQVLFVITTSADSIDTRAVAINRTMSPHPSKVLFFVTTTSRLLDTPSHLPLVSFISDRIVANQTLLQALHHVSERYGSSYNWFFFSSDDVYVNSDKIVNFLEHISVAGYNLIGKPVASTYADVTTCDTSAGILMSSMVLSMLVDSLQSCTHIHGHDTVFDVQYCLARVAQLLNISCTDNINEIVVSFYSNSSIASSELISLSKTNAFNDMLTVGLLPNHIDIYAVHRYACEAEMAATRVRLSRLIAEIAHITPLTPDGNKTHSWPIDIDAPVRPRTRHDIAQWTYFTDSHIYAENDHANYQELKGLDREDIMDAVNVIIGRLNSQNATYEFRRIINGYRWFDATRGMDYLLDLALTEHVHGQSAEVMKSVGLLRPLGMVEIVPTPFVTESTRVHLVLPVAVGDRDVILAFLDSYVRVCVDAGDNADLLVVLMYPYDPSNEAADDDTYAVVKSTIAFYESRFARTDARITWLSVVHEHAVAGSQAAVTAPFIVVDSVMRRFSPEALIFICSIGMELSIELLNRVRMNTIVGFQVYFPIGFWSYKPSLIHDRPPYPATIEVTAKNGYFDWETVNHASFYCSDYLAAQHLTAEASGHPTDLYELFILYGNGVHVLHAVEPALRLQYREDLPCKSASDICPPPRIPANREQLAMLVFEYQQSLDQQQIDVMHKQRDENVAQMKPDMF